MAWLSNRHAPTKPNQLCVLAIKVDSESIDYLPAVWDMCDSEDKHFTLTVDRPDLGDIVKLEQVEAYMIFHPLTVEDKSISKSIRYVSFVSQLYLAGGALLGRSQFCRTDYGIYGPAEY